MICRDIITKEEYTYVEDGMGGYTSAGKVTSPIRCQISQKVKPDAATLFGLSGEKVIYVATLFELDNEPYYSFNNRKYQIRFQSKLSRIHYSTLVEVKEEING